MTNYIRQPEQIYAASFAMIRAEADLSQLPTDCRDIAVRIIHSCGMTDIATDLRFSTDFAAAAAAALRSGAPILVDAEMVRHGIIARKLPGNKIICTLNDPQAREVGMNQGITRSAAAVSLWQDYLAGSIVVVGNAPTALFALLEGLAITLPRPAAIIGFPVGFVGAAESKELLVTQQHGIPFATILGRRGGSAMAASVVNALAEMIQ